MTSGRAHPAALAAGLACLAAVGCGGATKAAVPGEASYVPPPAPRIARYLDHATLQLRLGDLFSDGLYRLAVMTQPGEDAADLGQSLPTGQLRAVSCDQTAQRPPKPAAWAWRCGVRWRTVGGGGRQTRYDVELTPRSCFAALAKPAYGSVYDKTTGSASQNPLNALVLSGRQCR